MIGLRQATLYRASELLRLSTMHVTVNGQNVFVRPRTSDLLVAKSCFEGEFDHLADCFDTDFDGVIVDAGGYIGTSALSLSRLFSKATIVTIEPSSSNFGILMENTKHEPRIQAIKAALATEAGKTVWLQDRHVGNWGFSIIEMSKQDAEAEQIEAVETISIDEIRARYPDQPIGILKLDIEGAEKALFENAQEQLNSIPVIFAELHDFFLEGCEAAFRAFSSDRKIENFGGEKFLSLVTKKH